MQRMLIFIIHILLHCNCSGQFDSCMENSIPAEKLKKSVHEIELNFVELKDANSLPDGSIIIGEKLIKDFGLLNDMKSTLELFQDFNILVIRALSPDLVFYLTCQSGGFFSWKVTYIVYNKRQTNPENLYGKSEKLIEYSTIYEPDWFKLKIKQFID
jgi:hypothetical protein